MKIKKFNEMNVTFKSEEDFIKFWNKKWKGTVAENFPNEFLKKFPCKEDYSEFEKEEFDYQDEDDEFYFDAGDESNNIDSEFGILIGEDISEDDWVNFYNSCWTWMQ